MANTDVGVVACRLFFRPLTTRVPLKFGAEITTQVLCARAEIVVAGTAGPEARGWGETPLSVAWVWPASLPYEYRQTRLRDFCVRLSRAWARAVYRGHPLEIGKQFIDGELKSLWEAVNREAPAGGELPWLAALVCNSLFDIALHDAYGMYHGISTWDIYRGNS